jgi:hypothetical protein
MFKAIGTVIVLWWLAAHLPATFGQLDHTGAAVLGAIETIATTTAAHGIQIPQVIVQ